MTKDTNQDPLGGTKKFLYTGSKKRGSGFDNDDDQKQFNFTNTSYNANSTGGGGNTSVDLEDVWSIKKNVNVSKQSQKPGNRDGWSMNVSRGFYSRHGGLNGEKANDAAGNTSSSGGKNWGQQKNYSYSYTSGADQGRGPQASYNETGSDGSPGGAFAKQGPGAANTGRYGVQNSTSQNSRFNMNNF